MLNKVLFIDNGMHLFLIMSNLGLFKQNYLKMHMRVYMQVNIYG